MEANMETLRTRLTQVAELRDPQGLREDHRALVARRIDVEEFASVHTLREFMTKIIRLETMVGGNTGEPFVMLLGHVTKELTVSVPQ